MSRRRDPSLWTDRPDDWPERGDEPPRQWMDPLPPEPPRKSRRTALIVGAAVLVGAGGASAIAALGDDEPDRVPRGTQAAPLPAVNGQLKQSSTAKLYAGASGAVVSIRVRSGSSLGSGTGFLIDKNGTVVTNAHVVQDARTVAIRLDDGAEPIEARVAGTDPSTDLAVLRADPDDVKGITPLKLADSDDVRVGDYALAIGFPLGLDRTATEGIISGLERVIEAPNGFRIDEVLQTDAPINPGNSGGPLLDGAGRVIGVNSQIATAGGGGGNVGIGFAVPSNTAREIVPRLLAGERIRRPFLGVSTGDPVSGPAGATVAEVVSGGPSDRAGIRVGDRITAVDGKAVREADDVADSIADLKPGDEVDVKLTRGGAQETVRVRLGTRPEQATP
ncbi:PDZ domain-containing protein [Conexibacter sp. W3-3-2]|uniref:S1C family serine protease n=1 Tax=Conexibacter sp. W3-3-2 TaxID=2675227 RepID=UPI0012B74972|nr:trypsin-like peptidase domain-containing protein [Conexibacter sp. W3-3-2]MTD46059.1 PDZ domain-containing protein [Conexibacter sp. W3-3-2]